jgi:preprotein translocase subunit SecG
MYSVLLAVQLIVSVSLVISILLQRSEGGALGMGGGGAGLGGLFSPRGATNTLTRTTAILAVLFFATSLALTLVALHTKPHSILDSSPGAPAHVVPFKKQAPQPFRPQAPAVPLPHG